eukprot:COSAG01_NODE_317_length_18969_cov_378.101219_6_plen_159_part_00
MALRLCDVSELLNGGSAETGDSRLHCTVHCPLGTSCLLADVVYPVAGGGNFGLVCGCSDRSQEASLSAAVEAVASGAQHAAKRALDAALAAGASSRTDLLAAREELASQFAARHEEISQQVPPPQTSLQRRRRRRRLCCIILSTPGVPDTSFVFRLSA